MTVTNDLPKSQTIHNLAVSLKDYRHIILILGLGIWIVCPLVGVVILLILAQINVSTNRLEGHQGALPNIFLITLVLFTITAYTASIEVFGDLATYISIYEQLAKENIYSWPDLEFEPISFIIPKYIGILSNGNVLSFLFIQSLTINSVLTAYSIMFSADFYPLIILINLMTAGYYHQLFILRQYFSFLFIIPAIYISTIEPILVLLLVAFYTHRSSFFYFLPLIIKYITEKTYFIGKFIWEPLRKLVGTKFLTIIILVGLILVLPLLWKSALRFLSTSVTDNDISQRVAGYGSDEANLNLDAATIRAQLRVILDYITISLFALGANFQKVKPQFHRWLFIFFTMLLGYVGAWLFHFNLRLNALFFCLPGFFYMIPLFSEKMTGKFNFYTGFFLFSLAFRFFYFFYSIIISYQTGAYLTFWDGDPLFTPITSYFELFFRFLASPPFA